MLERALPGLSDVQPIQNAGNPNQSQIGCIDDFMSYGLELPMKPGTETGYSTNLIRVRVLREVSEFDRVWTSFS